MNPIKRIAIIGAGAIGGAYASMFYDMSNDSVSFIAGESRFSELDRNGIVVNGKHYNIPVCLPGQILNPFDMIIIAVKHHHLDGAIHDLNGSVGDNTIMLSFMNGIESEEAIRAAFGVEKVLYSIVLGIDAVRLGNSIIYNNQGRVFFGETRNDVLTLRVERVKELFERAGINCVIPADMIRTMWWKFMINVGINQASAAFHSPYILFQSQSEARTLMDSAMREVMVIAQSLGINLNEVDIHSWHDILSKLSPEGKTSMLQDVEAGRKTEVEMFAGKVIELGRRLGIPTPVNEKFLRQLEKY
jgi:2-dehydropantoate 2-reductase